MGGTGAKALRTNSERIDRRNRAAVRDASPPAAGRRPRLARALRGAGLLPLVARLRRAWREDLRILAYHRVLPALDAADFRFDPELVSASVDAFRVQLALVRRHCAPLRFDELLDHLDRGRPLPPRAVLITFDDGYDDNYRHAYPLLREAGLSAMFFVSTGHIDSGRPYLYDWLVHMLSVTHAATLDLPEIGLRSAMPAALPARRALAAHALDRMKTLDAEVQRALVGRLAEAWDLPIRSHPDCRPMDWDMLRVMQAGGMEIGSHGVDHNMLAKLPPARMREEVFASRARLQAELGAPADVISYPVGGHDAYDAAVVAAVRDAGYRVACSYVAGAQPVPPRDRYGLKRIPVERHMDAAWFEGMLALPELFCYRTRARAG